MYEPSHHIAFRCFGFRLVDALVFTTALILVVVLGPEGWADHRSGDSTILVLHGALAALACHLCLGITGSYIALRHGTLADRLGSAALGALGMLVLYLILASTCGLGLADRRTFVGPPATTDGLVESARIPGPAADPGLRTDVLLVIVWWASATALVIGLRLLHHGFRYLLPRADQQARVLLTGNWQQCRQFARHLLRRPEFGLIPVAIAADRPSPDTETPLSGEGLRQLEYDDANGLKSLVRDTAPDRVIICAGLNEREFLDRTLVTLRDHPTLVHYCPDLSTIPVFCLRASEVAGRPMLDLTSSPWSERAIVIKTVEDKVLALIALAIFGLPMLLIALIIKLTGPGPVLFVQERHGLGGKPIRVFKFRTMRHEPTAESPATIALERRSSSESNHGSGPQLALTEVGHGSGPQLALSGFGAISTTPAPGSSQLKPQRYSPTDQPIIHRPTSGSERLQRSTARNLPKRPTVPPGKEPDYQPSDDGSDSQRLTRSTRRRSRSTTYHRTGTDATGRGTVPSTDFHQATRNDPRISRVGRFLRATSLDELPQLLNVLNGSMSMVGPRPHAVRHNEQFSTQIRRLMRRHFVKPGITGLAQVNGARGETRTVHDMRRRVTYDLHYISNWSLWLDIKILFLTLFRGFINRQP